MALFCILFVLATTAVAILAQSAGLPEAISAITVMVAASMAFTLLAILLARRAALKSLQQISENYRRDGSRALYGQYAQPLLELPASEQLKLFARLARHNNIDPERYEAALVRLRSAEFKNSLDRVRSALSILLGEKRA